MSAELHCSQVLLLQADFDGELDAAQSAALQVHLESCAICGPALSRLERARSLLAHAPRFAAPERLRAGVLKLATAQPRSDVAPAPRASAFATRMRYMGSRRRRRCVGRGRSDLHPRRHADVAGRRKRRRQSSPSDAVARPLGRRRIERAPHGEALVRRSDRFRAAGEGPRGLRLSLRGGRVDVVDGRNAAVLVYQAGRHTIDVSFRRARGPKSAPAELRGFNVRRIEDGEFSVWAVSDLNARELDAFVEHWKSAE